MREASFIYHGSSSDKDRRVTLRQDNYPPHYRDSFVVSVEGMPALTQTVRDEEKALAIFDGFYQMAWKDWGPSEINWSNW